jgi:hypothetical protein
MHPIYFKDNIEDRYQVGQSKRVDVVSTKIDKTDDLKIFFLIKHINRGTDFINISEMFRNLKIQKLYFDHIKEKKQSHTINCVIFRLRQN